MSVACCLLFVSLKLMPSFLKRHSRLLDLGSELGTNDYRLLDDCILTIKQNKSPAASLLQNLRLYIPNI